MKHTYFLVLLLVTSLSLTGRGLAQHVEKASTEKHSEHVLLNALELAWGPAPASLPPGAEAAILEGNPAEEGPFTVRVKMPEGYTIPPHWHPGVEHVTVISGVFNMGRGEKLDKSAGKALTVGGFMAMPPKSPHFAWTDEATTIQLHGIGPWGITYINQSDDPRIKATQ